MGGPCGFMGKGDSMMGMGGDMGKGGMGSGPMGKGLMPPPKFGGIPSLASSGFGQGALANLMDSSASSNLGMSGTTGKAVGGPPMNGGMMPSMKDRWNKCMVE